MKKIIGYARLIRVTIVFIIVGSFNAALYSTGENIDFFEVIKISTILYLMASGGFAWNDYFDQQQDKINNPGRALPQGQISPVAAKYIGLGSLILAFTISIFSASFEVFSLSTFIIGSLFLYSYMKKRWLFPTIFITPIICTAPIILAALLTNEFLKLGILALLTFLLIFGREIIKDISDIHGDRLVGVKTLPIIVGKQKALGCMYVSFGLLMIMLPIPYLLHIHTSVWFLVFTIIGVSITLSITMALLHLSLSQQHLKLALSLSKYALLLGILGFIK